MEIGTTQSFQTEKEIDVFISCQTLINRKKDSLKN